MTAELSIRFLLPPPAGAAAFKNAGKGLRIVRRAQRPLLPSVRDFTCQHDELHRRDNERRSRITEITTARDTAGRFTCSVTRARAARIIQ